MRAVVAHKLNISAPGCRFSCMKAANVARAFPVNDHGSAARIQFLIFQDGRYLNVNMKSRHTQSPAAGIGRARARAAPLAQRHEREIFARKMRPRSITLYERAA